MPTIVNRLISLPVFAFLSLTALLFLFSSQLSRLSVPRSMPESGTAIAAVENPASADPHTVGSFPDPTGTKVSPSDPDSSVEAPLDKAIWKLRDVPSYPRHQVHSRFSVAMVYGNGRPANPPTRRSHSHPARFFLGLAHQFGAFMSRLPAIGVAARVVQKERLVAQTPRRPRKEIQINERPIRSRLTSSFRPAHSALLRSLAKKGREFALR
jgi:hypothetical protein